MAHCGHSIFETKLVFVLSVCACVCVYSVPFDASRFSFFFFKIILLLASVYQSDPLPTAIHLIH